MIARSPATLSSLQPVGPSRSLVMEIGRRIAADIAAGRLMPGTRLPTEQEMMGAMGVSRTVVREAVATLRAEGLVATRQGIGSFVAEQPSQALFRIEPGQAASLADALHVMELRTAVETESAGLAAARATMAQRRTIHAALAAIDMAIERDEPAISEDFAFHAVIADATGNPQFRRFLDFLGRFIIPRADVRIGSLNVRGYVLNFQQEHRVIVAAIDAGSVAQAQAAMRAHLVSSSERYQALAPDRAGRRAAKKTGATAGGRAAFDR